MTDKADDASRTPVFASVHDVSPAVMSEVQEIVDLFQRHTSRGLDLLVVPGHDWSANQIDQLRRWQDAGHALVGHGWSHVASDRKDLWHRIHSLTISRNVAEHLSKSQSQILGIVQRCYDWFSAHHLDAPQLYVPPAWAMGRVSRQDMANLPFRFYENLFGYFDSQCQVMRRVPLLGYEADNRFRSMVLTVLNTTSGWFSSAGRRPLRMAIHPHDLSFRLSLKLRRQIETFSDPGGMFYFTISSHWLAAENSN